MGTEGGAGIVVVGCSLGGLEAVSQVLGALPARFRLPIALVLHRSVLSGPDDQLLERVLARRTPLVVREAEDKAPLEPGCITVAPSDYHLLVDGDRYALSTAAKVNFSRPSIDVLFESAADSMGKRVIAVVLTGSSADGARGAAYIKRRGGRLLVQHPDDAESGVMPAAVLAVTSPDRVLLLNEIAGYLELCAGLGGA